MPVEKGFAKYSADGKFDVAQDLRRKLRRFWRMNQWSRYIQGRDYFAWLR